MDQDQLRKVIEGALLAAGRPLDIPHLQTLFEEEGEGPERDEIRAALEELEADCRDRSYELTHTASGYRFQVRQEYSRWINRLWEEKPKKYGRALLETLALVAYRQPITRGDIEQIRGVAVSSDIIRTLMEREWVRVVGHRDVPGRPALYATTRQFLDYFNLQSLDELPPLSEIRDLEEISVEFDLDLESDVQRENASESKQAGKLHLHVIAAGAEATDFEASESEAPESGEAESEGSEFEAAEFEDTESEDTESEDMVPVSAESLDAESEEAEAEESRAESAAPETVR